MHRFHMVVLGTGLLWGASVPAFADDAVTSTTPAESPMEPWPDVIIERPYVLPAGMLAAYADLEVARISFDVAGMSDSVTEEGLHLGAGYGVTDKITAGFEYAFALHEFEIKGPLTLWGELKLAHTDKLNIAASAALVVDLNASDAMGMSTTTETLVAGLGAAYKLTPTFEVFTGSPVGPGPVGQHLQIGFQSGAPITFDVLAGAGLQATPQLFAYASTNLAHISISNSANGFFGADFIPLSVGAFYAANKQLDLGVFLNFPDLKNAQLDVLVFGAGLTWFK